MWGAAVTEKLGRLRLPFLILLLLLGLSSSRVVSLAYAAGRRVSEPRMRRIRKHLEIINKPPAFTIQSPDGDFIDCIHERRQPAFDHPLLKHHKVQKAPPDLPRSHKIDYNITEGAWQAWHVNGTRCPKGTVPIRRTNVDDVLRAKSLCEYGKKKKRPQPLSTQYVPDVISGNGHEHAIAYTGSSELYGAKATINVWDPWIEHGNEFSLSQVWILSGSFDGSDLNSIEAGWQVSPELYGDSRPRLFTYWTSDSYQATGCYNLLCSGFIQTTRKIAIGAAISPVSSFSGNQFDITILIWKDPKFGNWWLRFGETLVGYWPSELFTHLADHATMVEFGGEVVNSRAEYGAHTTTQMGSGRFAEDGFGRASYFRNLEVVDSDNSLSAIQSISTLAEDTDCYDIRSSYDEAWGSHFYYGGPGKNPRCP
ncbi:hypothetical protein MLD38_038714 [Melastoma candidum]|uniref:Uncharacterized protein n=1 Tax=Melastoma candidum TaxID=119954 RepID=A0ACB9KZS4_9MYRT|nr:hypothetical protein MLD38_038714 [Melastoma candidum]